MISRRLWSVSRRGSFSLELPCIRVLLTLPSLDKNVITRILKQTAHPQQQISLVSDVHITGIEYGTRELNSGPRRRDETRTLISPPTCKSDELRTTECIEKQIHEGKNEEAI